MRAHCTEIISEKQMYGEAGTEDIFGTSLSIICLSDIISVQCARMLLTYFLI